MKTTRRSIRTAAVAVAAASIGLGLFGAPGTAAQETVPGAVDLQPELSSAIQQVTVGKNVLFEASVTQGTVPTPGTATFTVPSGFTLVAGESDCSVSAGLTTATCTIPLGQLPAQTTSYEFLATAPATADPSTTATLTVAASADPLGLEYTPDNTATLAMPVVDDDDQVAAGLVPGGGELSLSLPDGREYRLQVPASSPGVIVEITAEDGAGRTCGPDASAEGCGNGFGIVFYNTDEYNANDPEDPLIADLTFGILDPCRGLGNSCTGIAYAQDVNSNDLEPMPLCDGAQGAEPGDGDAQDSGEGCINQKYKLGGDIWFDVRFTSEDPVKLPPLSL